MLDWKGTEVTHPEKWLDFPVGFSAILTVLNIEVFQFSTSLQTGFKRML